MGLYQFAEEGVEVVMLGTQRSAKLSGSAASIEFSPHVCPWTKHLGGCPKI